MTICTKTYLDYQTAMEKFHQLMQQSIVDYDHANNNLFDHYNIALSEFVEWSRVQPEILPWPVHRRLKQLRDIFFKISRGRGVCYV